MASHSLTLSFLTRLPLPLHKRQCRLSLALEFLPTALERDARIIIDGSQGTQERREVELTEARWQPL